MSESLLAPESIDDLQQLVASHQRLIPVGNQTKPPLSRCAAATKISLRGLRGILDYEPSEFTFTAQAGTPLKEIVAALSERDQYLPFDPLLVEAGATIGGTVAAGLSGPGRFRYGGVRDFVLGVDFISGDGKLIRGGGKVVKNAAGFDLPKFLVGSLGRFGLIVGLTFKVFPKPTALTTLQVSVSSHTEAMQRIAQAAASFWELDAIDYRPDQKLLYLRVGGPEPSNRAIAREIQAAWGNAVSELADAAAWWKSVVELSWREPTAGIIKIPVTPAVALPLFDRLPGSLHASAAANVLWQLIEAPEQLEQTDEILKQFKLAGLLIRGGDRHPFLGSWTRADVHAALQRAVDPAGKWPSFLPAAGAT